MKDYADSLNFENDVRRIARSLWPQDQFSGAAIVQGRERDGIFETQECVHILECTISRRKDKAIEDIKKIFTLIETHRKKKTHKAIKGWFVTLEEPTADQRSVATAYKSLINILSFSQFQSLLIDANLYLSLRKRHKFGSIYNPNTGDSAADLKYIPIDLIPQDHIGMWKIESIVQAVIQGKRFVLLGDYGVGKSMSLREIFFKLEERHCEKKHCRCPIYINLREHHGQNNPAEILERHARNIGFPQHSNLVRAWKAGHTILLIDGFDEVSSLGLQGAWQKLKEARYRSMTGVRQLINESPEGTGICIAGRNSFFDTDAERKEALGLTISFIELILHEFNESQMEEFLESIGYKGSVPAWLPSRPLLLSTLFSRGTRNPLQVKDELFSADNPSEGWHVLLNELCNREARIEAGISGTTIRKILESLATIARATTGKIGPMTPQIITQAFEEVVGYFPNDEALVVLQRLPGLGRAPLGDATSRVFIDSDLADAASAGDVIEFIHEPFTSKVIERLRNVKNCLGNIGRGLAAVSLKSHLSAGHFKAAIQRLEKEGIQGAALADVILINSETSFNFSNSVYIYDADVGNLEINDRFPSWKNVSFDQCIFTNVEISQDIGAEILPIFKECLIHELEGRLSEKDLPTEKFINCSIEHFADKITTIDAIMKSQFSLRKRVLLTILKKLFVQSLSGRKEIALYRGLDQAAKDLVQPILKVLQSYKIIALSPGRGDKRWMPMKRQYSRVLKILNSPSNEDSLILEIEKC